MAMSPTTKTHTHQCSQYGRTFQPFFGSQQRNSSSDKTTEENHAGVMELLLHRRADMNSRCFSNLAALGFDPLLFQLLFSHSSAAGNAIHVRGRRRRKTFAAVPACIRSRDEKGTTGLPKRRYGSGRIPNCNGRSCFHLWMDPTRTRLEIWRSEIFMPPAHRTRGSASDRSPKFPFLSSEIWFRAASCSLLIAFRRILLFLVLLPQNQGSQGKSGIIIRKTDKQLIVNADHHVHHPHSSFQRVLPPLPVQRSPDADAHSLHDVT